MVRENSVKTLSKDKDGRLYSLKGWMKRREERKGGKGGEERKGGEGGKEEEYISFVLCCRATQDTRATGEEVWFGMTGLLMS